MGIPWDRGVFFGFPWNSHGKPMGIPWDFCWASWHSGFCGVLMCFPCASHVLPMRLLATPIPLLASTNIYWRRQTVLANKHFLKDKCPSYAHSILVPKILCFSTLYTRTIQYTYCVLTLERKYSGCSPNRLYQLQ